MSTYNSCDRRTQRYYRHIGVYSSAVSTGTTAVRTHSVMKTSYILSGTWYLVTSLALVLLVGIPRVRIYREGDAANVYAETGNRVLRVQLSKNRLHQGGAAVVRDVSSWRLLSCCLKYEAAGRVRSRKKRKRKQNTRKPVAPKIHHEIHNSPATVITSRRRAAKRVPRVSPYSHASIDPGFAEIGLVQLSKSVKNTNVIRTPL